MAIYNESMTGDVYDDLPCDECNHNSVHGNNDYNNNSIDINIHVSQLFGISVGCTQTRGE